MLAVLLLSNGSAIALTYGPTAPGQHPACSEPEYRQFDFWLGIWDVFDAGGTTPVAHVKVSRLLDGCVVHEDYSEDNGYEGQSFSIYDSSRRVWHQTCVTNRGWLLIVEGKMQGDAMVLSGWYVSHRGQKTLARGTWKAVSGGVREIGVTSTDGGKTWQPWFDLVFRPAKKQ